MACITHMRHLLRRDGTNQLERLLDALKPGYVNVDERSREELMQFLLAFSEQVQYYNLSNERDGDWTGFFNDFNRDYEPHLALMLTFLELFRKAQDHINETTQRHLEFYYKKILQIKEKEAEPDRVYLIAELAKGILQFRLSQGTEVKAGKDLTGKELYYQTEKEIVVNPAKVGSLRTIFLDKTYECRIYSAPKADSADGVSKPLQGEEPKWCTFGRSQSDLPAEQHTMTEPETGFAVASSLLLMREGTRSVTLTCAFDPAMQGTGTTLPALLHGDFSESLIAWFSGEKEWIGPFPVGITPLFDSKELKFEVVCDADKPAIVSYSDKLAGDIINTTLPVLKFVINNDKQPCPYLLLQHLKLLSASLQITVQGIQNLVLQNEQGPLDPSKPFMPFGSQPTIGSALYIGNEEVFCKKPISLDLLFQWKDLPVDTNGFDSYYSSYDTSRHSQSFLCNLALLQGKQWTDPSQRQSLKLFDLKTPGLIDSSKSNELKKRESHLTLRKKTGVSRLAIEEKPQIEEVSMTERYEDNEFVYRPLKLVTGEITRTVAVGSLSFRHVKDVPQVKKFDVTSDNGFLKLELAGQDFGHKEYPPVLVTRTMELNKDIADNNGVPSGAVVLPNTPYTPVMDYLKMNYSCSQVLQPGEFTPENGECRLFHVEPFGVREVGSQGTFSGTYLLPHYTDEGYLYIGIESLSPRQTLSLLFRIAESSSISGEFVSPEEIRWCYLSHDEWVAFKSQEILSDSTRGLLTTGIIEFDIPDTATDDNNIMPSGYHWLRISVPSHASGANQMISITSQAFTAVFHDHGNDPAHLEEALPAGTITKLAISVPGIKKISQPYSSFGGRVAESTVSFCPPFYTRVSERIRHKDRAVTVWDLEHLVLEKFPGIYKVKCLNHSSETTDSAPGHITMVVIENIRNKNAVNPLQPKTSAITLSEIGKFLEKQVSPFVTVHVQNPIYEEIRVDFKVCFHPGYDAGYYKQQLNEEIRKFLSPWAYIEGEDIMFGNIIYKSSILNFIEEREYVDYVVDFKLYHITESWGIGCMEIRNDFVVGDRDTVIDEDEVEAKTSRSILVSASSHSIYVLGENEYTCEGNAS